MAFLGTAALGCAGADAGAGTVEERAWLEHVGHQATANYWPQFQHDAVHSGINAAAPGFTSAQLVQPLRTAFKLHYGSSGDEAGAVEAGASSMWPTSVPIQTSLAASPRSTWQAAAASPAVARASRLAGRHRR